MPLCDFLYYRRPVSEKGEDPHPTCLQFRFQTLSRNAPRLHTADILTKRLRSSPRYRSRRALRYSVGDFPACFLKKRPR